MMIKKVPWLLAMGLLVAAGAATGVGFWAGQQLRTADPAAAAGVALEGGTWLPGEGLPVPGFALVDQYDEAFGNAGLRDRWTLMFFGYTYCPDICPMTLQTVQASLQRLEALTGGRHPALQVVFVSVDPERDQPARLRTYLAHFDPDYVGLSGPVEAVDAFARGMNVVHLRQENPNGGDYLVDHTASIFLLNPAGRLQAVFGAPHAAEVLAADLARLAPG